MKIIKPAVHGYLDYLTVIIFLLAPAFLNFEGIPAVVAYALAGVHLLMTILTDFPPALVKLVSFSFHGWVERLVGPILILAAFFVPGLVESGSIAQIFYVVMGIVIILVGLLTNYRSAMLPTANIPPRMPTNNF